MRIQYHQIRLKIFKIHFNLVLFIAKLSLIIYNFLLFNLTNQNLFCGRQKGCLFELNKKSTLFSLVVVVFLLRIQVSLAFQNFKGRENSMVKKELNDLFEKIHPFFIYINKNIPYLFKTYMHKLLIKRAVLIEEIKKGTACIPFFTSL